MEEEQEYTFEKQVSPIPRSDSPTVPIQDKESENRRWKKEHVSTGTADKTPRSS